MTRMQEQLAGVHIISLIGQQGTGKSTIAKSLASKIGYQFVEASDVVRAICGDMPRGLMYTTNERTKHEWNWLGKGIADRIHSKAVLVSGVREQENHDYFLEQGAQLDIVKLWAPTNERYGRLKKNGKVETYLKFIKHGQAELSIGLGDMLEKPYRELVTAGRPIEDTIAELRWILHL